MTFVKFPIGAGPSVQIGINTLVAMAPQAATYIAAGQVSQLGNFLSSNGIPKESQQEAARQLIVGYSLSNPPTWTFDPAKLDQAVLQLSRGREESIMGVAIDEGSEHLNHALRLVDGIFTLRTMGLDTDDNAEALDSLIPEINEQELFVLADKIFSLLKGDYSVSSHGDWNFVASLSVTLQKIVLQLNDEYRFKYALECERWPRDGMWWNLGLYGIINIYLDLDETDRREIFLKLVDRFEDDSSEDVAEALRDDLIPRLSVPERMCLLKEIFSRRVTNGLNIKAANILCQCIAEDELGRVALQYGGDVALFVDFYIAGIPLDPYFWTSYLEAPDKRAYLTATSAVINEHRRGKLITEWTDNELRLAYAGLDGPDMLSFEDFKSEIDNQSLHPLFLDETFDASVRLQDGQETQVAFVPSKTHADQFLRYTYFYDLHDYENPNLNKDFQIYRMISGNRQVGAIYVQNLMLEGKKALLLRVVARDSWPVDRQHLLEVIEENYGHIAESKAYDYVFFMAPYDEFDEDKMIKAIDERGYESIYFEGEAAYEEIFATEGYSGNEFVIMWKRGEE